MTKLTSLRSLLGFVLAAIPTTSLRAEPIKEMSGGEARAISVAAADFRLTGRKANCFKVYVRRTDTGYTVNFVNTEINPEFAEEVFGIEAPTIVTRPAKCPFQGKRYELSDTGRIVRRLPPPR